MNIEQDWIPVIFDKRNKQHYESKEDYIKRISKSCSSQQIITTTNKLNSTNKSTLNKLKQVSNLSKLESEEDTFKHNKVSLSMAKRIAQARCEKKLTQKDLALKLNLPFKIIQEYESSKAIPNHLIINKLENILGTRLRDTISKKKY